MSTLAVLAAAGLAARLAVAAPPGASALMGTGDVRIEGDVTYEPGTGLILVQNGAVIRRGGIVLRARSATYDPASGEVRASGGVLLTDALGVVAADGLRFVFDGPLEAEGVVAFAKGVPVDLTRVSTLDEARRDGPNRLSFSGTRLSGDGGPHLLLEGARLTLCDCGPGCAPSWEVTAQHADIIPGVRATLSWPVLHVTPRFLFIDHSVPVFILPWLYLPLGDRQTGLLLPEVFSTGSTGITVAQPVFVTLGRSADLTLTPAYAFGPKARASSAVRGPGVRADLRWAPAEAAEGQVELAWVNDLDHEPGGEGGSRFALTGRHAQRISDATALQATLHLSTDPVWLRDITSDVLGHQATYARSDVLLSSRRESLVLEADASYLEPLRPDGYLQKPDGSYEGRADFGTLGAGFDVASRWPAASATLVPVGLGPLRLSGRAGFARFAPPSSAWDAGTCWNVASGTGCTDPLRRAAADRADVRAEVSAPVLLGGVASLTPYVTGTAVGYAFEADHDPAGSAWGVGGVVLGTEVSRRFGELRNAIVPRLEWRAGTATAGQGIPWYAYDLYDRTGAGLLSAAPPGVWQQLRATVETRLSRQGVDLGRLELGQDYDVRLGRFAETFGAIDFAWRALSASASARALVFSDRPEPAPAAPIPSQFLDRFTELHAGASLADARGDLVRAGFFSVGPGGSGTLLAGIDPLFDLRPAPTAVAASASLGARVVAGGATLGYDVYFPGRDQYVASCTAGEPERLVGAWQPTQQTASATWDSPCHCFRIVTLVRRNDCGVWSGFATIDLARMGDTRAFR